MGRSADHPQLSASSNVPSADDLEKDIPSGFGKIIRDASGHVVAVELNEVETQTEVDVDDVDNISSRIDPEVRRQWASEFTKGNICVASNDNLINGKPHVCFPLSIGVQGPPFLNCIFFDTSGTLWNTRTSPYTSHTPNGLTDVLH